MFWDRYQKELLLFHYQSQQILLNQQSPFKSQHVSIVIQLRYWCENTNMFPCLYQLIRYSHYSHHQRRVSLFTSFFSLPLPKAAAILLITRLNIGLIARGWKRASGRRQTGEPDLRRCTCNAPRADIGRRNLSTTLRQRAVINRGRRQRIRHPYPRGSGSRGLRSSQRRRRVSRGGLPRRSAIEERLSGEHDDTCTGPGRLQTRSDPDL